MGFDIAPVRLRACKFRPYFSMSLLAMHPVKQPGLGTMAIDKHGRVYYDPDVDWTVEQAAWVFIHELGHWLRKHHERAEPIIATSDCVVCDSYIANIAQDCELNDDLEQEGANLPVDPATPKKFGLQPNLLWEQYYAELKKKQQPPQRSAGGKGKQKSGSKSGAGGGQGNNNQQNQKPQGAPSGGDGEGGNKICDKHKVQVVLCGSAAHGISQPYELPAPADKVPGIGNAEADMLRKLTAQEIMSHAKRAGSVPAGWKRWAEKELAPAQVPWERELWALVRNAITMASGAVDFSYTKPSRRGTFNGVIMPAMRRPNPEADVVIDTSGSMSEPDLTAVLSEVQGILRAVGQRTVRVHCCDAAVAPVQRVSNALNIELLGGGGTDMGVGIAAAEQAGAKVVIVLTDAYTPWPSERPRAELVIGVVGTGQPDPNIEKSLPEYATRVLWIRSASHREAA